MHVLVPQFILERLAEQTLHGHMAAASLFVDISGFTTITEALMAHGSAGAETLAEALERIFEPLVQSVYEHGGFIAGFAGDSLTALFPGEAPQVAARAVAAAWAMRRQQRVARDHATRFGSFIFGLRIGLAYGQVEWGIVPGGTPQAAPQTYYFRGAAVDKAILAQRYASAGDLVLDQALAVQLAGRLTTRAVGPFWRVTALQRSALPAPLPVAPAAPGPQQASFFAPELLAQPQHGEFRPVVTLFLNLAGNPRHAELAACMRLLGELRERYGGYLCRLDFGDKGCNLLLFWGAPISHEDDLERALQLALALRAGCAVPLRAGITSRRMYAGFAGSRLRQEYTCYGRGVNLAVRQMMAAPWDAIWLDEPSARRAMARFDLALVAGEHVFKGFSQPLRVFELLGQNEAPMPRLYSGVLIGRQHELARLASWVQPIFEGSCAGVMTIYGEAGVGKSRLLDEFEQRCADRPATWLTCPADMLIQRSLGPFRYALRGYFGQSSLHGEAENMRRFEQRLETLLAQIPEPAIQRELRRVSSLLAALVDLHWPGSLYEQLEPKLRFQQTLDALKQLFTGMASIQPLVLKLEDIHAIDADSLAFLAHLLRNCAAYPIAIVRSHRDRPAESSTEASWKEELLELAALPQNNIQQLAEELLFGRTAPELVDALMQRTDGNPFFAEQLLLYARGGGLLEEKEGTLALLQRDAAIPSEVRAVLMARQDRLPIQVKEVVQTAAVLGREFELPVLRHMLGLDEPQLQPLVATAEQEGIWAPLGPGRYAFKHALMRDAAYDMQLYARRRALHHGAAQAIEQLYEHNLAPYYGDLAHHHRAAADVERALHYLEQAAAHAMSSGAYRAASAFLAQGVTLIERASAGAPPPDRTLQHATFERALGEASMGLGELANSADHLRRALALLGFPAPTTRWRIAASTLSHVALQALQRCWPAGPGPLAHRAQAPFHEAARAYAQLGEVYYFSHNKGAGLNAALQSLNLAETAGPSPELARAYANSSFAAGLVPLHRLARTYSRLAWQTASLPSARCDDATRSWILFITAIYNLGVGHWEQAADALARAAAMAKQLGDGRRWDQCMANLAGVRYHQGDFASSSALYLQVEESARQRGDLQAQGWALGGQAQNSWRRGELERTVQLLEARLALLEAQQDQATPAIASYGMLALAHMRQGHLARARQTVEEARQRITRDQPIEVASLDGYAGVAAAYLALWERCLGQPDDPDGIALAQATAQTCQALRRYAHIFPIGRPRAALLDGLYHWASAQPGRALRRWRASLALAQQLAMPYDQALAHYELGRHGQGAERRHHLGRACAIFERLGAAHDLSCAEAALRGGA